MRSAVALARRALGRTWPNPPVGCVLVRDGRVLSRGNTAAGGRPHAEAVALERAGGAASGATAYVTLEPCAHHGRTPPCAEALIAAGIRRVVVAARDPDPRVDGRGIARLKNADLAVRTGVCGEEAEELLSGFAMRVREGRPLITLKLASTIDSRIATAGGESRWITGAAARRSVHLLRARHDAILVGGRTALRDDPSLTCRLDGLEGASPLRLVADGRDSLPPTHALAATADRTPSWLLVPEGRAARRRAELAGTSMSILAVRETADGRVDLPAALRRLGAEGLTSILVEGGAGLAASLLSRDLVDRLVWYRAPRIVGGDGRGAVDPFGVESLDAARAFENISVRPVGGDSIEIYGRLRKGGR